MAEKSSRWIPVSKGELLLLSGLALLLFLGSFAAGFLTGSFYFSNGKPVARSASKSGSSQEESAEAKKKKLDLSGKEVKSAFLRSKQEALVDLALRSKENRLQPKSISDAEAYFETQISATATAPTMEDVEVLEAKRSPAEEPRKLPKSVSSLFERKPGALNDYRPVSGSYTLQIASFPTEDQAIAKLQELRRSGFNDSYYEMYQDENNQAWFRVGIGSFRSKEWAQKSGDKSKRRRVASDFVIRKVP